MINGYWAATGGIVTQFNRLDLISNNLANVNTPGFKEDDVVIGDFERLYQTYRDKLPLENNTKEAAKFVNRNLNKIPQIVEEYTSFEIGDLQRSGNPLDVALREKNQFFVVDTPTGKKLTRAGNFNLDSEGYLITKEGYKVLDSNDQPIQLSPKYKITIDKNGNIYQNKQVVATFAIARVDNLNTLKKVGNKMWDFIEESVIYNSNNSTIQGFLEKSNVNVVTEMTHLIETNRLVDMYQKVMTTHMDEVKKGGRDKIAARA